MGWSVKMEMKLRFNRSRSRDVDIQYLVSSTMSRSSLFGALVMSRAPAKSVAPCYAPETLSAQTSHRANIRR
jgi:hypothetical protein